MNNITIELCKEDRGRIDNLIVELAALRHTLTSDQVVAIQPEPQEAETPEQPLPPVEEPKAEAPAELPWEPEKKAAPEPTPVSVQALPFSPVPTEARPALRPSVPLPAGAAAPVFQLPAAPAGLRPPGQR